MTALDYLREVKAGLTPEEQRMCDDFSEQAFFHRRGSSAEW